MKRMKKGVKVLGLFILGLVFTSMFSGFVSAQGLADLTKSAIDGIISIAKPYLQTLLGETSDGTIFVAKLLIFIILLSLVYTVLNKVMASFFEDKSWALWVVSIAVPLLGIRFLTSDLTYTIVLPNSVFAVAITAGLPFILYFFFVNAFDSATLRRISWIFFGVIFLALYTLRYNELGQAAWIYPLTAILAFVMAAMDGTLQRFRARLKVEKSMTADQYVHYTKILKEYEEANDALNQAKIAGNTADVKRLKNLVSRLHITLDKIRGDIAGGRGNLAWKY